MKKKPESKLNETCLKLGIASSAKLIHKIDDIADGDLFFLLGQSTVKICEFVNQKFKCRISLIGDKDGEMRSIKRGRITEKEISNSLIFKINCKESLIGFVKHLCPEIEK
jgi:hypothetical protein